MKLNYALIAADATASIHLGITAKGSVKCVHCYLLGPIPVSARSKAWVCSRWLAGIMDSNPDGIMEVSLM